MSILILDSQGRCQSVTKSFEEIVSVQCVRLIKWGPDDVMYEQPINFILFIPSEFEQSGLVYLSRMKEH